MSSTKWHYTDRCYPKFSNLRYIYNVAQTTSSLMIIFLFSTISIIMMYHQGLAMYLQRKRMPYFFASFYSVMSLIIRPLRFSLHMLIMPNFFFHFSYNIQCTSICWYLHLSFAFSHIILLLLSPSDLLLSLPVPGHLTMALTFSYPPFLSSIDMRRISQTAMAAGWRTERTRIKIQRESTVLTTVGDKF